MLVIVRDHDSFILIGSRYSMQWYMSHKVVSTIIAIYFMATEAYSTNLKQIQPVPAGGAVQAKVTVVFSFLLVWVAALYITYAIILRSW